MPRLTASLSMLFTEVPFLERFRRAADAGFTAVEFMFPYEHDAAALKRALADHGLTQALHNLPAGDWAAGERGIACLPDRVDEFRAGVDLAVRYATTLDCGLVNCLAGVRPADVTAGAARDTLLKNLAYAAPRLKAAGVKLLVEAVNTRDVPGFVVSSTEQSLDIIEAVGSDNLFVLFDVYHMQIMEGDLSHTIEQNLAQIAHIQVADTPGRHEPGTGEIHYPFLFGFMDRVGYAGWVGGEYRPQYTTEAGLGWAKPYLE